LFFHSLATDIGGKVLFILFGDSFEATYAAQGRHVMVLHITPLRATHSLLMFSILRFILIVGVIFYYSPVRQKDDALSAVEAFFTPKKSEPAAATAPPAASQDQNHLETVWKALPDSAKQAVVDKILTTSGLNPLAPAKPSDTLRPEDRAQTAPKPRT
jgi:hypothetical protein